MKFWDDTVIEILIIMGKITFKRFFLVKLIYFTSQVFWPRYLNFLLAVIP